MHFGSPRMLWITHSSLWERPSSSQFMRLRLPICESELCLLAIGGCCTTLPAPTPPGRSNRIMPYLRGSTHPKVRQWELTLPAKTHRLLGVSIRSRRTEILNTAESAVHAGVQAIGDWPIVPKMPDPEFTAAQPDMVWAVSIGN